MLHELLHSRSTVTELSLMNLLGMQYYLLSVQVPVLDEVEELLHWLEFKVVGSQKAHW
jgi:hypothetical protein